MQLGKSVQYLKHWYHPVLNLLVIYFQSAISTEYQLLKTPKTNAVNLENMIESLFM